MTLIDSIGDIIGKAREAAGVSLEAAAEAAGIPAGELETLERTGRCDSGLNLARLAPRIGLNPEKLQRIAAGWLPQPRDLTSWRELRIITTARDGLSVNCYLVWDEVSREGALFDTGWDAAPILEGVRENNVELKHLFITHTHEDHIAAMGALRERFPLLRLHTNSKQAPPQHRNRSNDFISLGSLRITNRDVPGHAEDGVIYVIGNWPEDAPHAAVVGDTIFAGTLATGLQSADLLKQKVREQIFTLPLSTLLCPGHGPLTTVAEERANNPFFD
jgi:glyoxylase-like metal-dependent hydrolase (beta-lactamase superfamily II)